MRQDNYFEVEPFEICPEMEVLDKFMDLEFDYEMWAGPWIDGSCGSSVSLVKQRFLTARRSVDLAITLLHHVSSSSKTQEKMRWDGDPRFGRWFGEYYKHGVKRLSRRYEKIRSAMFSSRSTIKCGNLEVNRANPITNTVVLGRNYKSYPFYEQIATLVHEIGHIAVGGTDFRYFSQKAHNLAQQHPSLARVNLDNLAYFATEVGGIAVPI